jgi:hypothetical protein
VLTANGADVHSDLLIRALVTAGVGVREVSVRRPTLEDVFFAVTDQPLRSAA